MAERKEEQAYTKNLIYDKDTILECRVVSYIPSTSGQALVVFLSVVVRGDSSVDLSIDVKNDIVRYNS